MLWGNGQQQRGFLHQIGDVIEHVFRPAARRQEMLLQEILAKLDRDNLQRKCNGKNAKTFALFNHESLIDRYQSW